MHHPATAFTNIMFVSLQVLFSEQVKLRNAISGNSSKKMRDHDGSAYPSARDHSQAGGQSAASRQDDSEADGLSLRESWLAARQDIKYLKQDMERMKAKYAHLEQESLTQQVAKLISLTRSVARCFLDANCTNTSYIYTVSSYV